MRLNDLEAVENPMVRDECWPEYRTKNREDDPAWCDYMNHLIDEARGK